VGFLVCTESASTMNPQSTAAKETKAQQAERLKAAKNPWQAIEELKRYARLGYESIPEKWTKTYLRWWGVYTQGDGAGALGGSGGEGKSAPYFMLRVRLANGIITSPQLRTLALLSERFARESADITVRQNIQLHWITAPDLPLVLQWLSAAGLTSMGTCGDDTRNITGCPLSGLDANEICDASPLALEATRFLVGNGDYYNLPRKYKISISGCRDWCNYPEINDLAFIATLREGEAGFSVRVGGGLSTEPHMAVRLNAFVQWHQVLPIVKAVTEVFRESASLREHRERARLKFLFLQQGWTAPSFLQELERRLRYRLDPPVAEHPPADVFRDHAGVHQQKQPGLVYIGAAVLRGRITPQQMRCAADLAELYGSGELRTTGAQNLVIVNVPQPQAERVIESLRRADLHVAASSFWRGAVACTGTEFCKLAITETKSFTRWLVEELEERLPEFDQQLKLNVTGCPNSCGQHRIADIGLEGKKLKVNGQMRDAYYFCLGGAVGEHAGFARPVGYRCLAEDVPEAIERLLRAYLLQRATSESLRAFLHRHSEAELRALLAGESLPPVARDPAPGHVPHGVEN
jgi:sulfite reductase (ferredoxin)